MSFNYQANNSSIPNGNSSATIAGERWDHCGFDELQREEDQGKWFKVKNPKKHYNDNASTNGAMNQQGYKGGKYRKNYKETNVCSSHLLLAKFFIGKAPKQFSFESPE